MEEAGSHGDQEWRECLAQRAIVQATSILLRFHFKMKMISVQLSVLALYNF